MHEGKSTKRNLKNDVILWRPERLTPVLRPVEEMLALLILDLVAGVFLFLPFYVAVSRTTKWRYMPDWSRCS